MYFPRASDLGPGLLESVYAFCLAHELRKREIPFRQEVRCPIIYDGERLDAGFRIDLIVDDHLIVELKSIQELQAVHTAQVLTYLKLTGYRIGLLVNFNVPLIKSGIRRVVL